MNLGYTKADINHQLVNINLIKLEQVDNKLFLINKNSKNKSCLMLM